MRFVKACFCALREEDRFICGVGMCKWFWEGRGVIGLGHC